jgi:hypothetical protein
MKRVLPLLVGVVFLTACGDTADPSSPDPSRSGLGPAELDAGLWAGYDPAASATYAVTVHNLTAGQPFTPPIAATHRTPVSVFSVGEPARFGVKEIAENGNLAPLHSWLTDERHVSDVVIAVGSPPPLLPGESRTFEITIDRGARYLSLISMLICTNDGFTGVDGLRLPMRHGETVSAYADAYDAGTEINTEDFADLVPPCPALTGVPSTVPGTGMSDPALAENGVVSHHPGIQGIADLSLAIHGWSDPVAHIEVERIE